MFIGLKERLEYRREVLEWQLLVAHLEMMLEKKEGWEKEKQELQESWSNIQEVLKKLYHQNT